jgi:phosphoribosylaminoimidazole-succinocarboxamide synthase
MAGGQLVQGSRRFAGAEQARPPGRGVQPRQVTEAAARTERTGEIGVAEAGLVEASKLPTLVLTPTTKAAAGHDEPMMFDDVISLLGETDGGGAAADHLGRPQHSFDKRYLRDWSASIGWDRTAPGPEIPADVLGVLTARYAELFEKITGRPEGA